MKKKVLINFAHPSYENSRSNAALFEAAAEVEGVTCNDLYAHYPDAMIDVPREQSLLDQHDIVIFQHPFFWYSSPALLKEWQDLVLTHGWAYGSKGKALEGKVWQQSITTGGGEDAYGRDGHNGFTVDEFLRPFEATAALCSMTWAAPRVLYAALSQSDEDLAQAVEDYRSFLRNLVNGD